METGLPDVAPISWAVRGGPLLVTAHVPIRRDGSFEIGAVEDQIELTFANLKQALEASGGTTDDVVQVIVYLTDVADSPKVSEVWKRVFNEPWPNRAIIGCSALTVPGIKVELAATAWLVAPSPLETRQGPGGALG